MLNNGDIIKLTFNKSILIGKIKEIGPRYRYIVVEDIVYMIPVKGDAQTVSFSLHKDNEKTPLHFMGGGYFLQVLDMNNELFKKYVQVMSGLVLAPGSKSIQ